MASEEDEPKEWREPNEGSEGEACCMRDGSIGELIGGGMSDLAEMGSLAMGESGGGVVIGCRGVIRRRPRDEVEWPRLEEESGAWW